MKISNKFFFLILFSLFILIPISSFSPYVSGQTDRDPTVLADFLKVELIGFDDTTPGDTKTGLSYISGGRDLYSFENKGILEGSYNSDTNTFVVWAEATFGFEITAWSANVLEDIYPEIDIDAVKSVMYFRYRTWIHGQLCIPFFPCICMDWDALFYTQAVDQKYLFHYYDIDYGTVDNEHDHNGNIETKIWIDPGRKLSGKMTVAEQTFTVPKLEADILDLTIADMRGGECGGYEDRYTDADMDEEHVEFTTLTGEYYAGETQKIVAWLNEQQIGFDDPIDIGEISERPAFFDLSFKGRDYAGTNTNEMTFNVPVHLQPGISKYRQQIPYKWGDVWWYDCCHKFKGTPVVGDGSIPRDLSAHVYNVFAHYDFEVKTDLFMDCQFTGELSESFLEDPNLVISDRIWDGTVWGETPDIPVLPEDIPWYIWILIIFIIGIGVYVGYKLITSRKKPVQMIMRR